MYPFFDRGPEFNPLLLGSLFRESGQQGSGDSCANQRFWHLEDHPSVGQDAGRTDNRKLGGQVIAHDEDRLNGEHGDQSRSDQLEHLDHALVQFERGCPVELEFNQSWHLYPQVQHRAQDHTVDQPVNAHPQGRQSHGADVVRRAR